jgi:hypothetical protein
MTTIKCPELCPDCPLAEAVPSNPRELETSENFIAKGTITHTTKGDTASFDFEHGRPTGPYLVEVGLVPEGGGIGLGFWVDDSLGLVGVARAIENCEGPKKKRSGFMKLGKNAVCGAVLEVAQEV